MAPLTKKLVIFDFDGTLFDTHASISHSIKLTFDTLLASPQDTPSEAEIHRLISSGAGLQDTFRTLQPLDNAAAEKPQWTTELEERWIATYRELYAQHGQPLIKPFPSAVELLQQLKQSGVVVSIVSNKGVAAVVTALNGNGFGGVVDEELIVGDKTPGATRKPDTASFTNVLLPRLKDTKYEIEGMEDGRDVLVVGDTVADIQFAANIGAKSVWCRYGYGDRRACEGLKPDYTVDSLAEDVGIAFGH
ncbi:HAD-like domain-containing protein [Trichoderma austrokoningii]